MRREETAAVWGRGQHGENIFWQQWITQLLLTKAHNYEVILWWIFLVSMYICWANWDESMCCWFWVLGFPHPHWGKDKLWLFCWMWKHMPLWSKKRERGGMHFDQQSLSFWSLVYRSGRTSQSAFICCCFGDPAITQPLFLTELQPVPLLQITVQDGKSSEAILLHQCRLVLGVLGLNVHKHLAMLTRKPLFVFTNNRHPFPSATPSQYSGMPRELREMQRVLFFALGYQKQETRGVSSAVSYQYHKWERYSISLPYPLLFP